MNGKNHLKLILILAGVVVVLIIAAFFFLGHPPNQSSSQSQTSSDQFKAINIGGSANFYDYDNYDIKLVNVSTLEGKTYAVLNIVDTTANTEPTELYIGANQYVGFGNGTAPYVLVGKISDNSASVDVLQNIPTGFSQAPKNGRQVNYIAPNEVPNEFIASTWTTDKPANYSDLVTIVFSNSKKGVKYELVNGSYMAESFRYKIVNKTIQMTNLDNSTLNIPFNLSGYILTLDYKGQTISLNLDWQNMTYLTNWY